MAMASAPPVTPIPHCRDWRSFLEVLVLSAARMRRAITLRNHSPTWMGLTAGVVGCSGVGGVCVCVGGGGGLGVAARVMVRGLWDDCSCLRSRCRRFLVVWEEGG